MIICCIIVFNSSLNRTTGRYNNNNNNITRSASALFLFLSLLLLLHFPLHLHADREADEHNSKRDLSTPRSPPRPPHPLSPPPTTPPQPLNRRGGAATDTHHFRPAWRAEEEAGGSGLPWRHPIRARLSGPCDKVKRTSGATSKAALHQPGYVLTKFLSHDVVPLLFCFGTSTPCS